MLLTKIFSLCATLCILCHMIMGKKLRNQKRFDLTIFTQKSLKANYEHFFAINIILYYYSYVTTLRCVIIKIPGGSRY